MKRASVSHRGTLLLNGQFRNSTKKKITPLSSTIFSPFSFQKLCSKLPQEVPPSEKDPERALAQLKLPEAPPRRREEEEDEDDITTEDEAATSKAAVAKDEDDISTEVTTTETEAETEEEETILSGKNTLIAFNNGLVGVLGSLNARQNRR